MEPVITIPCGPIPVIPFGTNGARALVLPGPVILPLTSHAACDELIKAASAAKNDIPVDYYLSLYGPALAADAAKGQQS